MEYFNLKYILLGLVIVLMLFLVSCFYLWEIDFPLVEAASGDNISGSAWSSNVGWISFNSTNCDVDGDGVMDRVNVGPGSGDADALPGCPPDGTTIPDYGVHITSTTKELSGEAWSSSLGWLSFDAPDPGGRESAYLDEGTDEFRGWARFCSAAPNPSTCGGGIGPGSGAGGWDGWVSLRGTSPDYGVRRDLCDIKDFAWGGLVVGWIGFTDVKTTVCGNNPPSAIDLDVDQGDYCFSTSPPIFLNWTFSDLEAGDSQSAYRIQVDNNSDFSSPEIDSGKVLSVSTTYAPPGLSFNTTYYWRVIVWDSTDTPSSNWIVYQDNIPPPESFITHLQPPWTDFDIAPPSQPVDEIIQFTDQTAFYGTPGSEAWAWDFGDGIGTSIEQNPTYSYSTAEDYTITLTASDINGSCTLTKTLTITFPLPEWKEVTPTAWLARPNFVFQNLGGLEKFLASTLQF